MDVILSPEDKAFNLGYNSYRIDAAEPKSPFFTGAMISAYDSGWRKAKHYHAKQATALRTSNFR